MYEFKTFEFDDLQALLRYGHKYLTDSCFLLLNIVDNKAAAKWLGQAPVSGAKYCKPVPETALQVAFSVQGLRAMGVAEPIIEGFSDEFITGMSGDESRSRRLGDTGTNAPEHWQWGGEPEQVPHILLMLYAKKDGIDAWRQTVETDVFRSAFELERILPTDDLGNLEPFGFVDGISQPVIDWLGQESLDHHDRDSYSNFLATGETVLGYENEYKEYTVRPLIDPKQDSHAELLPYARDKSRLKDFGKNGSYLVIRQLHQDVPGFWQFLDKASGSVEEKREQLAAAMVGRERDGTPLTPPVYEQIPGVDWENKNNHFTYDLDQSGHRCPIGAHIRRSNPRNGDFAPGATGFISRMLKRLGFCQRRPDEDLIASTRFHRLLRRGRAYGPLLTPEDALKADAPAAERGLQFICLVANISRQFEFVQNAWAMSSRFGGTSEQRDPIIGVRTPLQDGSPTDSFHCPKPSGVTEKSCEIPQFTTVLGGGYFFMPGLRALHYISLIHDTDGDRLP